MHKHREQECEECERELCMCADIFTTRDVMCRAILICVLVFPHVGKVQKHSTRSSSSIFDKIYGVLFHSLRFGVK